MGWSRYKLTSKEISLVAVFAALYVALSVLPGLPTPGDPTGQIRIEIEASMAPLYGIMLGPYLGALAALIGTLLAWLLPPSPGDIFGLPALFCPAVDALSVGLILRGKWKEASALLATFIALYWLSPICLPWSSYWYVGLAGSFDKLIALSLIPPTALAIRRTDLSVESRTSGELAARTGLLYALSFIGNEFDSSLGCTAYVFFLVGMGFQVDMVRFYYICAPIVYFLVRVFQALIATAIGGYLLRRPVQGALRKAGVEVLMTL